MFHPGEKVVCVDDGPIIVPNYSGRFLSQIKKGQVYVIDRCEPVPLFPYCGVVLVGISDFDPVENCPSFFNPVRFRRLDEMKQINSEKKDKLEKVS